VTLVSTTTVPVSRTPGPQYVAVLDQDQAPQAEEVVGPGRLVDPEVALVGVAGIAVAIFNGDTRARNRIARTCIVMFLPLWETDRSNDPARQAVALAATSSCFLQKLIVLVIMRTTEDLLSDRRSPECGH
jgi:hypothetical protein